MAHPVATYRLQLSQTFTFRDVEALAPYLAELGVSDCYCSPILTASRGSTHGYDICDHSQLSPDLGTRADFSAMAAALRDRGLGLLVDFVPNHMGIDPRTNVWWRDVLEHGESSEFAAYFDIDWLPVKPELRGKVLLPILGDQYGVVLERGELTLSFREGALVLEYADRELPINPRQSPLVLGHDIDGLASELGDQHPDMVELRSILTDFRSAEASAHGRLAALVARSDPVRRHLDRALAVFNGTPHEPESFDPLHTLLEVQAYRLAYWRTAFDEINYRRFFDINDLAGLRMEDPRVFAATHQLLLELVAAGEITGIRLDHPDGLFDPAAYFESLAAAIAERRRDSDVYIVVEKILGRGEQLRTTWPVHGTTGYGFLNTINGLFVHPEGLTGLRRVYRRFTGYRRPPVETEYLSKRLMMRTAMASELNVLARALNRISETDRRVRDFTLNGLRRALMELVACFPVYRTYVTARGASDEDVAVVDAAIAEAKRRNLLQEPTVYDFIRTVLLPPEAAPDAALDQWRSRAVAFAQKFQQYTAPVVAKGLEDTAFYNDVMLISANEVGGDLRYRWRPQGEFHRENQHRLAQWPLEMTAGSTHDTKRGEDARARINVISELPEEWRLHVVRWSAINDHVRTRLGNDLAPDRNDEWLYYQSLVGAWPAEPLGAPIPQRAPAETVSRMQTYMQKAVREAKRHTSWVRENVEYEQAVHDFVEGTLAGSTAARFLASFVPFQRRLAWFGMLNSLAQLVLRLGSPGVPDLYQGSELWNFSLVDPDNRRPVDFALRRRLLRELDDARPEELLEHWPDGRAKLFTVARALRFRREHPDLLLHGEYEALTGDADDPHLIAFGRHAEAEELIVAVPRFLAWMSRGVPRAPLGVSFWRAASIRLPRRLARATFQNVFTGEKVQPLVFRDTPWLLAADAFQSWPVAMLYATRTR